eukprot:14754598-Alexandrium_andersonii.AAC.1
MLCRRLVDLHWWSLEIAALRHPRGDPETPQDFGKRLNHQQLTIIDIRGSRFCTILHYVVPCAH